MGLIIRYQIIALISSTGDATRTPIKCWEALKLIHTVNTSCPESHFYGMLCILALATILPIVLLGGTGSIHSSLSKYLQTPYLKRFALPVTRAFEWISHANVGCFNQMLSLIDPFPWGNHGSVGRDRKALARLPPRTSHHIAKRYVLRGAN